ncbi:lipopolysaccharide export system protein LptA [Mucilaginibacter sp. UYP25]|uniref:OstA-like protein n=1 Tax=unclassified Mucilaginibacter TaxID=2617802 RepID=UPI003399671B
MIKYIFSTFFILLTLAVSAQKKSVVKLIQSKSSQIIQLNGKNVLKVYQGVFQQDYSIMRSDSAYFYVADNAFDAFNNVHITQGDTLNIYSDKLNYNGNTKIAILTDNVKLIDRDATLTTNYLTYNTATRIGTYTGGGKLVNKDNTLTSKNGYYFAFSRDSYFRYNVVLVTPDALIKTDTLRYNTGSRIAYFYGPTNIYDTKDKKDTLYTENGLYNTQTEQAFFGKKNLYKQGTKTLKGDSLFYDKLKGYGRAVKRVTFHDREQNITLKGDLATYYKEGERTVVTQDPYVIIVTEEKDSTRTDTVPVAKPGIKAANPIAVKNGVPAAVVKKADALAVKQAPPNTIPIKTGGIPIPGIIDTLTKIAKANPDAVKAANTIIAKKVNAPGVKPFRGTTPLKGAGLSAFPMAPKDTVLKIEAPDKKVKRDSIYISADTLVTQILMYKDVKIMQEKQRLLSVRDTSTKTKKTTVEGQKKNDKFLTLNPPRFRRDTAYLHRDFFADYKFAPRDIVLTLPVKGKGNAVKTDAGFSTATSKADKGAFGTLGGAKGDKGAFGTLPAGTTARTADTTNVDKDPIFYTPPITLSDTARVRIIKAYHNAKLFKSDLQAKADSMFYSYADSTLRCYIQPLIWTQGSQLSADTITMQMKNKKMDNLNMYPQSFIVNIEKGDSTNFNQVASKRMKGFFKNGKLDRMFIVGNAESIAYSRDSSKRVDGMQRSLASKMRIYFKNNSANNIFFISKPEHRYGPLAKFKEDDLILKGFIWKPKERPVSKESIIPSYNRKIARAKAAANKKAADADKGKMSKPGEKVGKDSLQKKSPVPPGTRAAKDSTGVKSPVIKAPAGGAKADSAAIKTKGVIKAPADKAKQDKTAVTPIPVTKAAADTLKNKPAATLKTKKDSTATKP